MPPLDPTKALLKGPDFFPRFTVPDKGVPLAEQKLKPDELLIVIERNQELRAFCAEQLAYHHAAQGVLGGGPYLVTF